MLLQLDPPFDLMTPKGYGIAYFLDSRGDEQDPIWGVVTLDGQFWFFPNQQIRFCKNISNHRLNPEEPLIDPYFNRYKMEVNK